MNAGEFLAELQKKGVLNAIDVHFGRLIARLEGRESPAMVLAALASQVSSARSEVCLNLAGFDLLAWANRDLEEKDHVQSLPEAWTGALPATGGAIGTPQHPGRPLILDGNRLYLQRDWLYERTIAQEVAQRISAPPSAAATEADPQAITSLALNAEQVAAAQAAMATDFLVITGGPGTGKTTIVAVILAMQLSQNPEMRVALCAQTGKAQARMQEALREEARKLRIPEAVRARLEKASAATLHRLLGYVPGSVDFRHNRNHPLPYDLVIVDEASMIPQAMMAKLLEAIPAAAKVVLLGDRDQLASVESGAVLADLCDALPTARLAWLRKSMRFDSEKGIGRLKDVLESGHGTADVSEEAWTRLCQGGEQLRQAGTPAAEAMRGRLAAAIEASSWGTPAYRRAATLQEAWDRFNGFRILCATNQGPYGTVAINQQAAEIVGVSRPPQAEYLPGTPVIVAENDYGIGLFNGDIGMAWPANDLGAPAADGDHLRIFFPDAESGWRSVLPAQLPAHDLAFALTVHKSQGSGFGQVLCVLPERDSDWLTRELLYTAITRAKEQAVVWVNPEVFKRAVARRCLRSSGLAEQLATLAT